MRESMEELIKDYHDNLPLKIQEIENLWHKLENEWQFDIFSDFHLKIHSLCGSAGLYGFYQISEIANELQLYLISLSMENVSSITKEQKDKIISLLNRLKETAIYQVMA